ncbi:MAG: hypothetical protein AAFV33_04935 [Chloroflexota bacterium]
MKRSISQFAQGIVRAAIIALLLVTIAACRGEATPTATEEPMQTEDARVTPEATDDATPEAEDTTPEAEDTTPEATDNATPEAEDTSPEATDNVTPEAEDGTPEASDGTPEVSDATPEVVENVTPETGSGGVVVETSINPELSGGIPNSETPDGDYSFSVVRLSEVSDVEDTYLLDASITNQSGPEITIDGESVLIVDEDGNTYGPVEMPERISPALDGTTLSETEGIRGFAYYEIPPDAVLSHAIWCPDEACEQVAGSAIP